MDALVTMSVPALSQMAQSQSSLQQQHSGPRHQTISVCSPTSATSSSVVSHPTPHKEATSLQQAGATVFVAGSVPDLPRVPEVQQPAVVTASAPGNHVVKIQINPDPTPPRLYSAVRINLEDDYDEPNKSVIVYSPSDTTDSNEPCVRISVRSNGCDYSGSESSSEELHHAIRVNTKEDPEMVQQRSVPSESSNASRASSSCFYYSSPLSTMVMSSGQCSPSETLDSGTCSDLDGTPPPLPKKKNNNNGPVVIGVTKSTSIGQERHDRTGSMTSSGAEVDSDDNESSLSCDSLNSGDLPAAIANTPKYRTPRSIKLRSAAKHRKGEPEEEEEEEEDDDDDRVVSPSVSKDSSTPRIRSPAPLITECTYEERRRGEQHQDASPPAPTTTGLKYVYEDDRYYKFHVNEREEMSESSCAKKSNAGEEEDESFAGYKILEREAIRSAKGTVRGVKNRVRAGIATFLQKPSTKVSLLFASSYSYSAAVAAASSSSSFVKSARRIASSLT